ncbi:MAG: TraX family protein, partial [Butyricicoccus pullicaecorum]|nr:TraX family protein [Butyricicoccus pullicaecorum]
LFWINVYLLGSLYYPVKLFGMELEIVQQGFALFALGLIWLYQGRQGAHSKEFQYFCYAFYPVHIAVLVLLSALL